MNPLVETEVLSGVCGQLIIRFASVKLFAPPIKMGNQSEALMIEKLINRWELYAMRRHRAELRG